MIAPGLLRRRCLGPAASCTKLLSCSGYHLKNQQKGNVRSLTCRASTARRVSLHRAPLSRELVVRRCRRALVRSSGERRISRISERPAERLPFRQVRRTAVLLVGKALQLRVSLLGIVDINIVAADLHRHDRKLRHLGYIEGS